MAVPAEADVGEPRPVRRRDAQDEVVIRDPGPIGAEHAGGQHLDLVAECAQQHGEGAVELVTEATAPGSDDLVQQRLFRQHDLLAQVEGEVLEGDGAQVAEVQRTQRVGIGGRGAGGPYPVEVGIGGSGVHQVSVLSGANQRRARPVAADFPDCPSLRGLGRRPPPDRHGVPGIGWLTRGVRAATGLVRGRRA